MTDLILALDVLSRKEAIRIAEKTAPHLDAIKIGYPLVLAAGLDIAYDIAEFGLPRSLYRVLQAVIQLWRVLKRHTKKAASAMLYLK